MSDGATLYLLRHGQTETAPVWRYTGQREVPLTAAGREQAGQWARHLEKTGLERIWTSPLSRCADTADTIAARLGCPFTLEPALQEIALGAWEGLSKAEVEQAFPGAFQERGANIATFRPPGGESFQDLLDRVRPWAEQALAARRRTFAVTHAGVVRVLACWASGAPLKRLFEYTPAPGTLSVIRVNTAERHLHALGLFINEYHISHIE